MASLVSHYMGVTQCNIAHAREKTMYQDADTGAALCDTKRSPCVCYHFDRCTADVDIVMYRIDLKIDLAAGIARTKTTISARSSPRVNKISMETIWGSNKHLFVVEHLIEN